LTYILNTQSHCSFRN